MKAQISFVEYLVAFVIFVTFVGYFSIQIMKFVPEYLNQIRDERIRSEAYQISEILIDDPGDPVNWNSFGDVKRFGLSDETKNLTNVLSSNKVSSFGGGCTPGYDKIKELLSSDFDFSITLIQKSPSETILINCRPAVVAVRAINTTIRRTVSFGSGYGELIVQMW
jgi:hypothetical protein